MEHGRYGKLNSGEQNDIHHRFSTNGISVPSSPYYLISKKLRNQSNSEMRDTSHNYKDLIDDIIRADQSKAEPLSWEERRIVTRIAMKFPEERMVYDAAHKEKMWKKQPNGAIIPYTDSAELIGI
jgi:hypothetical protein